ncbi:BRO-N domain-containing protein [Fusobacterium sp. THCT1E2]
MEKLAIVKFEECNLQLYIQSDEICMDLEEMTSAIGFSNVVGLKKLLDSNPELYNEEFSFLRKVNNVENGIVKKRQKRFFNEQGIYEVALLANTKRATNFRRFARNLITKYRKKEIAPLPAERRIDLMTNKLDKIEEMLLERKEPLEKIEKDTEDTLKLMLELEEKLKKMGVFEERLDGLEKKIGEIIDAVNELVDIVEGEDAE